MNFRIVQQIFMLGIPYFLTLPVFAQLKYEKETAISSEEVPSPALEFVSAFPFEKNPTWYKETGIQTYTFEAKLKHEKQFLSIEFSKEGTFEDLEIDISPKEIPASTRSAIDQQLAKKHGKYKIRESQVQYTGQLADLLALINGQEKSAAITERYELVISTKIDGEFQKLEYLFGKDGSLIRESRIILEMSDNLEY